MSKRRIIPDDSDEESVDSMDFDTLPTSGLSQAPRPSPTRSGGSGSGPAPPTPHRQLATRLEGEGGVLPSQCWLDQCLRRVGLTNDGGAVWDQLLRADLRDVVREDDATNAGLEATSAMHLRNAMARSRNAAGNPNEASNGGAHRSRKATLPSTFKLLVQMEEIVDVSMSSEQQVAAMGGGNIVGPSNASNRYNGGGQQQQGHNRNPKATCLKMTFSDGYHPDGRAFSSSSSEGKENDQTLEAMAPSSIQRLSISSPPGTKLLLHGAIDIREGMLELNDGNCVVMGGEIEEWKDVWKKARERVQREKGLGVDPTIKALIWNPLMGDEEEADEGEGESGDVTAAPAPLPPVLQAPLPAAAPPARPNITPNQSVNRANANNHPYAPNRNQSTNHANSNSHAASTRNWNQNQPSTTANAASRNAGSGNMRQMTMDAYPKQPRPETTRLLPKDNSASASAGGSRPAAQQQPAGNNPYHRGGNSSSGGGGNPYASIRPPPQRQQSQQQRQPQQQMQPPMRNDATVIPVDDSPPAQQPPKANPYASLRESDPAASTATAPASFNSNPSFSELKSILQSLKTDRALYEQYYDKTMTVPCKISKDGDKLFNIVKAGGEKKSKGKSKKEKKYEFLLVGYFLGPKQSDGSIACRVESSVLEPYFGGYSAAEIRKFSREDKARSSRIVNQGSQAFLHDYSSMVQVQMKLILAPDEFFRKISPSSPDDWMADTGSPFLTVTKKL